LKQENKKNECLASREIRTHAKNMDSRRTEAKNILTTGEQKQRIPLQQKKRTEEKQRTETIFEIPGEHEDRGHVADYSEKANSQLRNSKGE